MVENNAKLDRLGADNDWDAVVDDDDDDDDEDDEEEEAGEVTDDVTLEKEEVELEYFTGIASTVASACAVNTNIADAKDARDSAIANRGLSDGAGVVAWMERNEGMRTGGRIDWSFHAVDTSSLSVVTVLDSCIGVFALVDVDDGLVGAVVIVIITASADARRSA